MTGAMNPIRRCSYAAMELNPNASTPSLQAGPAWMVGEQTLGYTPRYVKWMLFGFSFDEARRIN
jgi:hypothetical protein